MTVREYLIKNPGKASYTIKASGKNFLCNLFDANSIFGEREIEKIVSRYGNKNLPLLIIV